MDSSVDKLNNLKIRLDEAERFDEVMSLSRDIFFLDVPMEELSNYNNLQLHTTLTDLEKATEQLAEILMKYLFITKNLTFHKTIIKTIVRVCALGNKQIFKELSEKYIKHDKSDFGATCLSMHAALNNSKSISTFPYDLRVLHEDFVRTSLKYSEDTKYFALSIENYILAYDQGLIKENHRFTFTVICTNLENGHNVHKILLDLFKAIVKIAGENEVEIVDVLLNEMSWYNRNKHYLLSNLIAVRPEMLLEHKDFDLSNFLSGLRIGLSQYHLYSSSLTLVKMIHNKEPFRKELLKLTLEIFLTGLDYEVKNLLKLWFTSFDDKFREELFQSLSKSFEFIDSSSTAKDFYRAIVIRNGFNRVLNSNLENSIQKFYCSIDDVNIKIEIFNILINEIYNKKELSKIIENILRFLKFLTYNICVEDSIFVDTVIKKLPNFFNFLATTRFRNVQICKEIFGIIRDDLYNQGISFGSYESRVFSIKMLGIMLKQYCGCNKSRRLSKKTDDKQNKEFRNYLRSNKIWNITSKDIFMQLVKSTEDTENSDICYTANEIIKEHFIKTLIIDEINLGKKTSFLSWINSKVTDCLNISDIESYHENISHVIMKFEYLIAKDPPKVADELLLLVDDLKLRSMELKISKDPLQEMQKGRNIFVVIDCINYVLPKADLTTVKEKVIPITCTLMKLIAYQFLEFVNDGQTSPSFDVLDEKLLQIIAKSSWKVGESQTAEIKHKLLLLIFFTLRSLSELAETIAKIIVLNTKPSEKEFSTIITSCIDTNIQILTRFCHKGAIESASQSLGMITKVISNEFLQQCDRNSEGARNLQIMLVTLKHEIDCGKQHTSKSGEIRGSRGMMLMSHQIIRNHPSFLKFFMEKFLITLEIKSFYDVQKIQFVENIQPIHLHLIAVLVKDSNLVEEMLKYYDFILLATFKKYKETKDFVMQNALLQIIGSITTKISNHKRHSIEESEMSTYESKANSVYEFYVKITYAYRTAIFDMENNMKALSQTYIIILLEILSNFEYRKPYDYWSEMDRPIKIFYDLIDHSCEKIRVLAAKCYAQWHLPHKLSKKIKTHIPLIFSTNSNLAHGTIVTVRHMIQRYDSSVKFVNKTYSSDKFMEELRSILSEGIEEFRSNSRNFYLKCHLLDFLLSLKYKFNDDIVQMLMNETNAETSDVGYSLWCQKVKEYRTKEKQQ